MKQRAAMTWARRLNRVLSIDISECEQCQRPVKIIACIEDPVVIEKILAHQKVKVGDQASSNNLPPLRGPPWLPGLDQGLID